MVWYLGEEYVIIKLELWKSLENTRNRSDEEEVLSMKRISKLLSLALALLLALLPLTAWAEEPASAPIDAAPAETEVGVPGFFS